MEPVPFVDLQRQYRSLSDPIDAAIRGVNERCAFILGEEVARFEQAFAAFCGVDRCVGVASGTAALELGLRAFGVGPGDEVITVCNTFIATVQAIQLTGARPVLVDCLPGTYLMNVDAAAAAVTERTRVVIPVHLYGQPVDVPRLRSSIEASGARILEDAAQAHGATLADGRTCGALGDAAAFSFYPSKNLGAHGDAGAFVSADVALADRVQALRTYGATAKHHHAFPGTNGRIDTLQAAILEVKLERLAAWNEQRVAAAARYAELLGDLEGVELPEVAPWTGRHVYHLYVVRIRGLKDRDALVAKLRERGIATGVHYPRPVHLQPACAELGYGAGAFPVAEGAAGELLSLPMFPELRADEIERTAAALREALGELRTG